MALLAFRGSGAELLLPPTRSLVRAKRSLASLPGGGGSPLAAGIDAACALADPLHRKGETPIIILLTDGQAEYQGILELTDQMVQNKITVSTVGVGAGADQTLLTAIAEHGGGRFYFTQDASSVPKIFTKETTQVARSALIEERVVPKVSKFVELLDGVQIEQAPPLRGYVSTKAKPLAEVILVSPLGEPLLARWRQGLGQAVAFTSDAKNRWAVDWLRWPGYAKFWAQLVRSSMRHDGQRSGHGYELQTTVSAPFLRVRVDAVSADDRFLSGLQTDLEVISPSSDGLGLIAGKGDVLLRKPMSLTAPGRYEAEVRLHRVGSFLLRAVHRSPSPNPATPGPVVAESWGTLSLPYPREYLALPPDDALLSPLTDPRASSIELRDGRSNVLVGSSRFDALKSGEVPSLDLDLGGISVSESRDLRMLALGTAGQQVLGLALSRNVAWGYGKETEVVLELRRPLAAGAAAPPRLGRRRRPVQQTRIGASARGHDAQGHPGRARDPRRREGARHQPATRRRQRKRSARHGQRRQCRARLWQPPGPGLRGFPRHP